MTLSHKRIVAIIAAMLSLAALLYLAKPSINSNLSVETCKHDSYTEKLACWDAVMNQKLRVGGITAAFQMMDGLFVSDIDFQRDCHSFAHKIGEEAYYLYAQNKDLAMSPKASYCGYGFYHGFVETLLLNGEEPNTAKKFCQYLDEKLSAETNDAGGACYHGIGHGVMDGSDKKLWGDPIKMIAKPIKTCESLSSDEMILFRCATGVFNSIEIMMSGGQFGLSVDKERPLVLCEEVNDHYKEACYSQMVVVLMYITNNDTEKEMSFINKIPEDKPAISAMETIIIERVHQGKVDHKENIDLCRSLADRFRMTCLTGFASGFLKYGPPEKEYEAAVKFCGDNLLTDKEKTACYSRILGILRIWYTKEKSTKICESVPEKFRVNDCIYN